MTALHDIADLWRGLDDTPDDLGRLLIIADAYREEGMDALADCLEWCYRNGKKPTIWCQNKRVVWFGSWCLSGNQGTLPSSFDMLIADKSSIHYDEYLIGHKKPSFAYQFLCRMWDEIGGVKEDV